MGTSCLGSTMEALPMLSLQQLEIQGYCKKKRLFTIIHQNIYILLILPSIKEHIFPFLVFIESMTKAHATIVIPVPNITWNKQMKSNLNTREQKSTFKLLQPIRFTSVWTNSTTQITHQIQVKWIV